VLVELGGEASSKDVADKANKNRGEREELSKRLPRVFEEDSDLTNYRRAPRR
jgi:hypothetical protein